MISFKKIDTPPAAAAANAAMNMRQRRPIIGIPADHKDIGGPPFHLVGDRTGSSRHFAFGTPRALRWPCSGIQNPFYTAIFGAFGEACEQRQAGRYRAAMLAA